MSFDKKELEAWLRSNRKFLDKFIAKAPQPYVDGLGIMKYVPGDTLSALAISFLTNVRLKKYLVGDHGEKGPDAGRILANKLMKMNEHEVFMELVKDINSELDVDMLCHKILRNISILTKSDRGSLFLTRGSSDRKFLVSKLFDVTQTSRFEESLHNSENAITVPFGTGIVGHVALNKVEVNLKNAYDDPRFNQEIDRKTGYHTHSLLCMPILNSEGDVIGVAQIINKIQGSPEFTNKDVEIFRKYLMFCGIGILNAQLFEMAVNEYQRNNLLLKLARGIFEEQSNLTMLMQKIMLDSHDLLKCERSTVYLLEDFSAETTLERDLKIGRETTTKYDSLDDVKFSTGFRLYNDGDGTVQVLNEDAIEKSEIVRLCKLVVLLKETINCPNLKEDARFCDEDFIDDKGFQSRSVLSMPIFNSKMRIIGVTQFSNKENGYDENDENIIEAFSIFAGLGIHNCMMYENVCKLMAKQKVSLEVLSYHATASDDEVIKLRTADLSSTDSWGINSYEFDGTPLDDMDMCKVVMRIFCNIHAMERFHVTYELLCRWTLSVHKNYRPMKYHNWHHVVNVFQTMYAILFAGKLRTYFTDIEIFALLAACLCHDLDNRGANQAFRVKTESPLVTLYGTSIMEHHHFDQCIMILNSDGNNIFLSLSADDYRKALHVMEHAVLATDVALHFRKRGEFRKLMEDGQPFRSEEQKSLLSAMMMTICDLAPTCKPWKIQYRTALLVAAEQIDLERELRGLKPTSKTKWTMQPDLPKMQLEFINTVCMPLYSQFKDLEPALSPLYAGLTSNRRVWKQMEEHSDVMTALSSSRSKSCVIT